MNSHNFEKHQVSIERMTRKGVEVAIKWAQREDWNPGIHDADCFFSSDPEGFYAAKIAGEVVATVSVVKYSEDFAFEGLLIVKPDFRGKGIGLMIQSFVNGLCKNLNLGLDGVLPMQEKHERVGFKFAHKNTRYGGIAEGKPSDRCMPVSKKDFAEVASFDSRFFPATRFKFLECWFFQKDASALMVRDKSTDAICSYGVIRKCARGHKIGPLFAEDEDIAEMLFGGLVSTVAGEEVFLDVPEPNRAAMRLAQRNGMQPVFSTARMYTKTAPALPLSKIYGVTSFELG